MGEIAEMMLDGTMCACCGEWLHDGEDGYGFPGYCASCAPDFEDDDSEESEKPIVRTKQGNWIEAADEQKCIDIASAAIVELERVMQEKYGQGKRLSKGSRKRLRKTLSHAVIQGLQHQGVI